MTERFCLLAIVVVTASITACTSLVATPTTATSIPLPSPTKEPTLSVTPKATSTQSATATIEPTPDFIEMDEIEAVCGVIPSTELIQLSSGSSLDIIIEAGASSCYKVAALRSKIQNPSIKSGVWNHILHQGADPNKTLPAVFVYLDRDADFVALENFFTPTPTPLSISHKAFDVDIIGVNEHGAMLELIYSGDINDLTDLEIKAELIQNGILEEEQAFNKLDGKLLAELTDAIYNLGELTVILQFPQELESLGGSKIELKIDYDRLYPWMHYIYGDSELANRFNYPWDPDNIEAWDLQPISDEFPTGEGHPVNSPCKGFVIQAGTESSQERNLWIYCEETGYYIELGHMDDDVSVDAIVDMHTFVGYINNETGWPHSHTKLRRPKSIITDHHDCLLETFDYADMFNPHVHLGGEPLPYGFWLEDTLPEEVRNAIEEGVFQWPE